MRRKVLFMILPIVLLTVAGGLYGRQEMKRITVEGDAFMIPEAGCLITLDSTKLKVVDVMPAGMRPKEYASIEFHAGDFILMLNGTRPKSVKELREMYEHAGIGAELKFGIGRGAEKQIIAFKKADPATLPKRKMVTVDDAGGEREILPGLAMVEMKEGKIVVKVPLPESESTIKENDILRSLNGTTITSLPQLHDLYKKISTGNEMELGLVREGKTKLVKMKKPEPKGQMIIQK